MSKPFHPDTRYARSVRGLLKVVEFLMLLIAVICILQYNTINNEPIPGPELFFLCACLSGFLFIVFIYWVDFFQLDRLCCSQTSDYNIWDIFMDLMMAVLYVDAIALQVILVHEHGNEIWHFKHLLIAIVFCFIASLLFLIDSIIGLRHLMKKKEAVSGRRLSDDQDPLVVPNNND